MKIFQPKKKVFGAALAVVLASSAMVAVPISAEAASASKYNYACFTGGSAPIQLTKKSDPRKCHGIYKISKAGKYVVVIDNRQVKSWSDMGKRITSGYKASQKWCAENSLTCTIVTTAGFLALQGVWAIAKA